MRFTLSLLLAFFVCSQATPTFAGSQLVRSKVIKVLPHLMDKQGRIALAPSLYERDSYQAELRKTPKLVSGVRYDIQWKSAGLPSATKPKIRLELRTSAIEHNETKIYETDLAKKGFTSRWSSIEIKGADYEKLGKVTSWRVTLWDGATQLAEQHSFLWQEQKSPATQP